MALSTTSHPGNEMLTNLSSKCINNHTTTSHYKISNTTNSNDNNSLQQEQQQEQQQQEQQKLEYLSNLDLTHSNVEVDEDEEEEDLLNQSTTSISSFSDGHIPSIFHLPIEILFLIFTPNTNDLTICGIEKYDYYSIGLPLNITPKSRLNNNNNNNNSQNQILIDSNYDFEKERIELIKSLINFSSTCKYFHSIYNDNMFWEKLYKRHFSFYSMIDIDRQCLSFLTKKISKLSIIDSDSDINSDIEDSNSNSIISTSSSSSSSEYNDDATNEVDIIDRSSSQSNLWKDRYQIRVHPWNVGKINCQRDISGQHNLGVTSLEVDNKYLFSGSHDTTIKMYDIDTLTPVHTFNGHRFTIWALKSDGKRLYSGSNDNTIRVWDLERKHCKSILTQHQTKIFSLAIKDSILLSTGDETIKVWNKKKLIPLKDLKEHTRGVNTMSVHNHHLVSGSSDKTVKIWDLNTMQCVSTKSNQSTGKVLSLAMVDSNTIATGTDYVHINIWDIRENDRVKTINNAHKWEVWQLNTCGGYLFSGSFDHTIKTWDLRNFQNQRTITGHRSYIHALTSSAFHLFSGSADKLIKVWSPC